jgi:hypothetical protein
VSRYATACDAPTTVDLSRVQFEDLPAATDAEPHGVFDVISNVRSLPSNS